MTGKKDQTKKENKECQGFVRISQYLSVYENWKPILQISRYHELKTKPIDLWDFESIIYLVYQQIITYEMNNEYNLIKCFTLK